MTQLSVRAVAGLPPHLRAGDDLAALLCAGPARAGFANGDVVCVSSKAVAKTEGRAVPAADAHDRDAVVDSETDRVVARLGPLRVVRTRHGLVLAAAGVDASNTEPRTVAPLPVEPDASARRLRDELRAWTGRNVAVVVTDTAGRAWRHGQSDIAVGCAGLRPLVDLAGQPDAYGRPLAVTAPAVADEVAAAADLVLAKAALTPVAVVSGLGDLVLPPGDHGPGAAALVRPEHEDLFGWGAADAVHAATRRGDGDGRGFAHHPVDPAGLVAEAAAGCPDLRAEHSPDGTVTAWGDALAAGAFGERVRALGWAHGLVVDERDDDIARPGDRVYRWTLRSRP